MTHALEQPPLSAGQSAGHVRGQFSQSLRHSQGVVRSKERARRPQPLGSTWALRLFRTEYHRGPLLQRRSRVSSLEMHYCIMHIPRKCTQTERQRASHPKITALLQLKVQLNLGAHTGKHTKPTIDDKRNTRSHPKASSATCKTS